jgi:uncharacterized phiE125 gp8 family phage protein
MIALVRTTEPGTPVVTTEEVKLYGRITSTAQDSMLSDLIVSATDEVEKSTNRALITQTWNYVLGGFDSRCIRIPKAPLQSITSIRYIDANGQLQELDETLYQVSTLKEPGAILLKPGCMWPVIGVGYAEPVTITYDAGYGDSSAAVPNRIRQTIIALTVYWHDNGMEAGVPEGIRRALDNYQVFYEF